ncbi:MAG: hypothetical protein HY791_34920 [Deltaproteobacteria bacterium]|nr:hypothetical protein [Deltaproteobacteria bacterium]
MDFRGVAFKAQFKATSLTSSVDGSFSEDKFHAKTQLGKFEAWAAGKTPEQTQKMKDWLYQADGAIAGLMFGFRSDGPRGD